MSRGYGAGTIDAIAAAAPVSPETVYAAFGSKRSLLAELVDVSIAGDEEPVPILERDWVRQMRAEPDGERRLTILAENGAAILGRWSPIHEILRGAADTDPEIAAMLDRHKSERLVGQRALLAIVARRLPLRDGLTARSAADVLFAVGSPETYRLLVVDRGWSAARFKAWYRDALRTLLFA